ncbi:uncharacterized protein LOC110187286 [Drosophila serrata]|uniref:uncharacterized protein LOC110187286 n=1 Tax=Drosophila serrata TaxID=7274 RepID=UPI000A1D3615|nr:uncharacterized protein LOC110187286 [Drosophila serrata]XP_020812335.1 uncharacterized protein LOC110187286 [Drosophila serrata]
MFTPIKKIFTYIQKNASGSNMFSPSAANTTATQRESTATDSLKANDEGETKIRKDGAVREEVDPEDLQRRLEEGDMPDLQREDDDDDYDIERQIKTSIIDATKVHAAKAKAMALLPLPMEQLDDELADFAHAPTDPDLEEQFLELENFPNNEIIVLGDADLNSSIASDAVSEDPLAIDNILDSSSVTTNEEVDTSGELLWLKLDNETEVASSSRDKVAPTNQEPLGPTKQAKTKEDELRDGGSDSGLGSETTALLKADQTEKEAEQEAPKPQQEPKPIRSNLKRRLDDSEADGIDLVPDISTPPMAAQKRVKRSINFDQVKVYYFPRQQGFGCVPTAGGCTLGMGARHIAFKTMTLAEHAAELRRAHRSQNQDLQPRGSSSDDSEESEEDYLSEGSGSDADDGSNGFLQPVTPKQRRALLKAAGVRKIDASEKSECRDIRNSREVCGCSCREFCDPETCACSQAGIKCQVDRAMFPCGCTREACGNTVGRVEFNPTRVRTHYIHTVMRLDMEQRQGSVQGVQGGHLQQQQQQQSQQTIGYSPVGTEASPSSYFLQTQSNYSSGYASPAYTPESSVSYYQQQVQQQQQQVTASGQQATHNQSYAGYPQLDSLDSGLFASGSNATPSYGELYQSLSYGSAQLTSYPTAYQPHSPSPVVASSASGASSSCAYSSCAVPSVPPYGNATTTASSNAPYQTTVASMTAASSTLSSRLVGNAAATASSPATTAPSSSCTSPANANEFISLSTPIASSSRLSQINDLLQHNRNTTAALVAVSEGYSGAGRATSCTTTIDSIDTPPIMEETQRGCMNFEALPPPLINPAPIVAVVESKLPPMTTLACHSLPLLFLLLPLHHSPASR